MRRSAPATAASPARAAARRRWWWRWWRQGLLSAGIVLAALELREHLPGPAATWHAVRQAGPGWLLAAAALSVVSMSAFAEQQRHLLAAFGVRVPAAFSLALSYARSAMATALPAGSAVSAGYAFRQYRARGATQQVAAAVMVLSGVASVAGLALLSAGDLLTRAHLSARALGITAAAAAVAALGVAHAREVRSARAALGAAPHPPAVPEPAPGAGVRARLRHTAAMAATVPARRWVAVIALAALNWLTDLACLLAAVHAAGLTVPVNAAATGYLVAQLARQIPVTPGGIGVIEAGLILALTTAGAAAAPAAAAVLLYRLLSCWSVLLIGLVCYSAQRPAATTAVAAALGGYPGR